MEKRITDKLNTAEENRLDQINSVVERMKEHVGLLLNKILFWKLN